MVTDMEVLEHIESRKEDVIAFMQKLIQTRSVTGEEEEIGLLMEEECSRDGLIVDLIEPVDGRISIVAKTKQTNPGPTMMMYSHYDTVPAGDLDAWDHPPFGGEIADGYLWGRGAQDNKIATCGLTMAYRLLKELGLQLNGQLIFTHVADEEKGGTYGFQEILKRGYGEGVDYLYYGHGGDPKNIGIAANGSRGASILVKGRSAHTAQLEDGVNAVVLGSNLVMELQELADRVNKRTFHLPGTNSIMRSRFSINRIHGYVANNNVPDECEIFIDRRYTPGENAEEVDDEYRQVMESATRKYPDLSVDYEIIPGNLVSVAPADSALVKGIQDAAVTVMGYKPEPVGGSHSSDHGWFVARHGKPFASYGVGGEGVHSANERILVQDIISTTKVYALSILKIMGVDDYNST
ncbi:M20/M25/M40 family metallo-hydrolase [Candidatus Bathyarchaeota archaeon]|nr:M20/M25/M40 family metallo-hydrolase [Candidatus Bathyarchaeota archaeon]